MLSPPEASTPIRQNGQLNYRKSNLNGLVVDGVWCDDPASIKEKAFDFFNSSFRESNNSRPVLVNGNFKTISSEDREELECFIREDEGIIKEDLLKAIEWFWHTGQISKGCNSFFLTLIPKIQDPLTLGDFWPISLIGRYILDGGLIANETVEFLKKKKRKAFLLKIDFEKAYDSVNWNFIRHTLTQMRFGDKWCKWIEACQKSATVSVLVNGSLTLEFKMERGIRQGDPLSPFLYLIAAEGLNITIREAVSNGIFKGVSVGRDETPISHLQYADDTLIFGDWNMSNAKNIMRIMECIKLSSGLKINPNKTKVYGIGVGIEEVTSLAQRMRCAAGLLPFTYLGLPVGCSMKRVSTWNVVVEKFKKRLDKWKAKTISFGGRLTLVKTVLSSLPLYFFSLFRAPASIIKKLESVRQRFFWGGNDESKKMAWVRWNVVLKKTKVGGLNIGSLKAFNWALLGKWWWRFRVEENRLWVKIIKSLYGSDGGLIAYNEGIKRSGSTWSSIVKVGRVIDQSGVNFCSSFGRKVGNGLFRLEIHKDISVGEKRCWRDGGWAWDWSWTRNPRGRAITELMELTALTNFFVPNVQLDSWSWLLDDKGIFTVKSLREKIDEATLNTTVTAQKTKWNTYIPRKICIFVWRLQQRRLPVRSWLHHIGMDLNTILCPHRDTEIETFEHFFISCRRVMAVWEKVFKL
ncbi:putative RNA-directed DNA polymerase [Tanacetum coccineum]